MILENGFITNAGAELLARAHAEQKAIQWTRCAIAATNYASSTEAQLKALTNITNNFTGVVLSSIANDSAKTIVLSCEVTNENAINGNYARSFGVWAKVEGDQYDSLLYITRNAGSASYINASSAGKLRLLIDVTLSISDYNQTTVTISPEGMATQNALAATTQAFEDLQRNVIRVYDNFLEAQKYAKDGDLVSIKGEVHEFTLEPPANLQSVRMIDISQISHNVVSYFINNLTSAGVKGDVYIIRDLMGYITGETTPEATPTIVATGINENDNVWLCMKNGACKLGNYLYFSEDKKIRKINANGATLGATLSNYTSLNGNISKLQEGIIKTEKINSYYDISKYTKTTQSPSFIRILRINLSSLLANINPVTVTNWENYEYIKLTQLFKCGLGYIATIEAKQTTAPASTPIIIIKNILISEDRNENGENEFKDYGFCTFPRANKPFLQAENVDAITCDGVYSGGTFYVGDEYIREDFTSSFSHSSIVIKREDNFSNGSLISATYTLKNTNLSLCRMSGGQLLPFID